MDLLQGLCLFICYFFFSKMFSYGKGFFYFPLSTQTPGIFLLVFCSRPKKKERKKWFPPISEFQEELNPFKSFSPVQWERILDFFTWIYFTECLHLWISWQLNVFKIRPYKSYLKIFDYLWWFFIGICLSRLLAPSPLFPVPKKLLPRSLFVCLSTHVQLDCMHRVHLFLCGEASYLVFCFRKSHGQN